MGKTTTDTTGNRGAVSKPEMSQFEERMKWYDTKIANLQKAKENDMAKHSAEAKKRGMIEALKDAGFTEEEIKGLTLSGN